MAAISRSIVVDATEEEPLPAYRRKLKRFATKNPGAFGYDPFHGLSDIIPSIVKSGLSAAAVFIEIVAEGSPVNHHDIGGEDVAPFAKALRPLLSASQATRVYLTGCNTGLSLGGYCIARELAKKLIGIKVCGSVGFIISGAAATEDAVTVAADSGATFPNARDDVHPTCWNCFRFTPASNPADLVPVQPPRASEGLLRAVITDTLKLARRRALPPLLIGPEFHGIVELEDGPISYEVLMGGRILRNAMTGETFDCPGGPELYRSMRP